MAGTNYHMEALRKQRVLERKSEAMKKLQETMGQTGGDGGGYTQESKPSALMFSEAGHYAQNRVKLEKFRVNSAGFGNRYRHRDNFNPHCDLAYAVVYPGKDNSDYTNDQNRNDRIMNRNIDKYEIGRKINGPVGDDYIDSFFESSSLM